MEGPLTDGIASPRRYLVRAPWIVVSPRRVLERGCLLVEGGRVLDMLPASEAPASLPTRSYDRGALVPGLVNAHAHLELSILPDPPRPGGAFVDWIRDLVAARLRSTPEELAQGARTGAERLWTRGAAAVGDVDSTGAGRRGVRGQPLLVRTYQEFYDLDDPRRRRSELDRLDSIRREPSLDLRGLSPHAPHTVGLELLTALGRAARDLGLPVTVHWAETPEEREFLEHARGPFVDLLPRPSPHRAGLDLLADAGLLGPRTSLVHGNDPTDDELDLIARSDATIIHCPGAHLWFDRPPFPLERYRAAGIPVALGTDSLAGNADLDPLRELRLFRRAHPWLSPEEAWAAATVDAARAIGLEEEVGSFLPGRRAVGLWVDVEVGDRRQLLESLIDAGRHEWFEPPS